MSDAAALALLQTLPPPDGAIALIDAARSVATGGTLEDAFNIAASRNAQPSATPRRRKNFAGLVLGAVAEEEFQRRYSQAMQGQEFSFDDERAAGTDTDFLVRNGRGRAAFRINIKAHGTFFQLAQTFVGLEPEDTFALATYKVLGANKKSRGEALPFLFAIVSSESLATGPIAEALPPEVAQIMDTSTLYRQLTGWKAVEDLLVDHMLDPGGYGLTQVVQNLRIAAASASWRVISAVKAEHLMNTKMYERVPAVSNPRFSIALGSQANMHYSLSSDMIGLDELLDVLSRNGIQHVATKIAYREL